MVDMEGERPSQLSLDEKWDKIIDLSLRRVVYSGAVGALTGLLLTSKDLSTLCPTINMELCYKKAEREFADQPSSDLVHFLTNA